MHSHLKHDKTLVGEFVRTTERAHCRARKSQDGGLAACCLWHGENAIDIVSTLVGLQPQVVHIYPIVALLLAVAQGGHHGQLRRLLHGIAPELFKVGRHGGCGLYAVRVEAYVGHRAVGVSIVFHLHSHAREPRHFSPWHVKVGHTIAVGLHRLGEYSVELVGTVAVGDLGVAHAHVLLDGIGSEMCRLARAVNPVGMVGLGNYSDILVTRRLRQGNKPNPHHHN